MDLLPLFYDLDEFCRQGQPLWQPHWLDTPQRQRHRDTKLSLSEVMALGIAFHRLGYRTFKHFYLQYAQRHLRRDFPGLVSYNRFAEMIRHSQRRGASRRCPSIAQVAQKA